MSLIATLRQRAMLTLRLRTLSNAAVAREVHLYSPDQARDEHGRFGEGGGSGGGIKLAPTTERAWTGKQAAGTNPLSKSEGGKLAETIVLEHLRQTMPDVQPYVESSGGHGNEAVDMVGNHSVIEAKSGPVTNSSGAQRWAVTLGEPSKAEKEQMAGFTKEQLTAYNAMKMDKAMGRKQAVVDKVSQARDIPIQGRTVAVIYDHERKIADVFHFEGFHARIGWNSPQAKAAYVGSYRYG